MSTVDLQDNNDDAGERSAPSGARLRLELFVEDMGATVGFYRRVLGFEVVREEPGDYASLRSGDVLLGIGPVSRLPERGGYFTRGIASQRRGLGVEIVIEVDDLGAAHRHVLASGHPVFERRGDDFLVDVPVSFVEAALGAEIEAPRPDGEMVKLRLPAGTQEGKRFKVRGAGAPRARGGGEPGDLVVRVRVVVPKKLSRREREILEVLAEEREEDVREGLLRAAGQEL